MSDVGGSTSISNVTLTFDPAAASFLTDSQLITSGSYKPTDFLSGDLFNSPAPAGPYGADFSVFNGTNPNGIWSLYVVDDASGDGGSITGGWSLAIGTDTPTIPVVTVAATDADAGEPANHGLFTLTRTGSTADTLTVNVAMGGTATNGTDYSNISTKVTFAAGSATALVNLTVNDDIHAEGAETATLTVSPGSGYTPGSLSNQSGSVTARQGTIKPSSSATISIADNDSSGTITLNALDMGWYDSTGFHNPLFLNYVTGDTSLNDAKLYRNWFSFNVPTLTAPILSAQLRLKTYDYMSPQTSETYELRDVETDINSLRAGGSGKTLVYADLGDGAIYGHRVYTNSDDNQLRAIDLNAQAINALTAKAGQAFAIGGRVTTLDTVDNTERIFAPPSPPTLADVQLVLTTGVQSAPVVTLAANYSGVSENGKSNLIYSFTRSGSNADALTVNFNLGGTATLASDFNAYGATFASPKAGSIVFSAGQSTAQIELVSIGDSVKEANETVTFSLASGSGYTIGNPASVTTAILNDDGVMNQKGTVGNDVIEAGTTRLLSGRAGIDALIGTSASDVFAGGPGRDTITTGFGLDTVSYTNASEGGDFITDFNPSEDLIQISAAGFGGGLGAGEAIDANRFHLGTVATTADHRFIFNRAMGQLFFDVDGNGSAVPTLLATLTSGLGLTNDNIFAA